MRVPDLIIGPTDNPQTLRWHLIRWRGWQLSLHRWLRSDDDRALHDHAGDNISILLTGCYWEVLEHDWLMATGTGPVGKMRWPLLPYFRRAETPHRIVLDRPIWSLWLRWPPRRQWGFYCRAGWRHWKEYIAANYEESGSSVTGRGCD